MSTAFTASPLPRSTRATAALALLRRLMRNRLTAAGLVVVGLLVLLALLAPWLAPADPLRQDLGRALLPPGPGHWFGTDEFGRDVLSRLLHGTRITLFIVVLVTVVVGPLGMAVGLVAGYFGGRVDALLMRLTDVVLSFPSLILALAFVAALGPGLDHAVLAIALTAWPPIARLARAEALTLRQADFIVVAQLQGASNTRVLLKHVLPLCLPSVVVRLTMNMASVVLTAAGLGFLGLGAQPPLPEWGAMISEGRRYMLDSWWLVAAPGAAILLVSMAFNVLGDGLNDVLDPRRSP
jgi:peptide/nickel transport system permease protein